MKKIMVLLLSTILVFAASSAFAAGSACAITKQSQSGDVSVYKFAWTSDDATGAVACNAFNLYGYIVRVVTNPGSPAPTAYGVTFTDQEGVDVMGGTLANRSATATEQQIPQINSLNVPVRVDGLVTVAVTNAGNSKLGEIILYLQR